MKTHYEILGVSEDATLQEINNAYKNKILKTETVQEAYKTLVVTEDRKQYDKKLEEERKVETYYDVLGVAKNANIDQIVEKYNQLSKEKRESQEISDAFKVLSNPKKRAKYNIKIGMIALKKEAKLELKGDIIEILNSSSNSYDSYAREIYIRKYENKIALIKQQIDLIQNEKDKDRLSYRSRLSALIEQLNRANNELTKWEAGRKNTAYSTTKVKRDGSVKIKEYTGKGTNGTFVSSWLNKSLKQIDQTQLQIDDSSNGFFKKTAYRLLNIYWKSVKGISSNSVKLYANNWSKIQDIIINRPSKISMFMSEDDFEQKVEEARTR